MPHIVDRLTRLLCPLTLVLVSGCKPMPKIGDYHATDARAPATILGPNGQLSPQASNAVMDRMKDQVEPTDILRRHSRLMEAMGGTALRTGNKVTLLIDGPATYKAMEKAIQSARSTINFESYIFEDDPVGRRFAELLIQKQAQGVQVDLLYDSVGSMSTPAAFFQHLRDGGVRVVEFNPINPAKMRGGKWLLNHRDHRKLLVVDGAVAFTGGVNISNIYSSTILRTKHSRLIQANQQHAWRDTDVEIEGPGVADMQKLFVEIWGREHGPDSAKDLFPPLKAVGNDLIRVVGSTPGVDNRFTYMMYVSAFTYAENAIHLTTPYFLPDAAILKALSQAAERGVDVEIILPGVSDSGLLSSAGRGYYTLLMKSGVKLYERRHDSMMHAKTAVIDHVWSTVGSTNLEPLSFLNNDEINAVILSPVFADRMEAMFAEDLQESNQILPEAWAKRPFKERMKEWASNLLGGWL